MDNSRKSTYKSIFGEYSYITLEAFARELISVYNTPDTAIGKASENLDDMYFPNDGKHNECCFGASDTLTGTAVMCGYNAFNPYVTEDKTDKKGDEAVEKDTDYDVSDLMDAVFIKPAFLGVCNKIGVIYSFPIGNITDSGLKSDNVYVSDFYNTLMLAMMDDSIDYNSPVFIRSNTGSWRSVISIENVSKLDLACAGCNCAAIELHLR